MARHQCLSCGEAFESPEFYNYMLKLRSKTVNCLRCQTDNFIVPKKNVAYFIFLLLALGFGLLVFSVINIGFAVATYNEADDTFRVGWLPLVGGGILALGSSRLIMNIFNWLFGSVSQDRKYKSVADFE